MASEALSSDQAQAIRRQGKRRIDTRSNLRRAWDRYRRNGLAMFGLAVALLSIAVALLAPVIMPYDPTETDFANINAWPSREHWFGTDASGVDIFSVMIGALRTSYTVAFIAQAIYIALGMLVGLTAGFFGGWVDTVLSRIIDILFSFPGILVAILISGTFGVPMYKQFGPAGRLYLTVAALAILSWVGLARIVRAQILSLRELQYVEAARVSGARAGWILRVHMLPNVLGTTAILVSLGIGQAMTLEAVLSYLGLGVTPPTPSLGRLIQAGQVYIDPFWYQFALPAGFLAVLVLAYAFIGDGLRDALDPRQQR